MANYYDVNFIERYIRSEAAKRGIDPDIAVRIARSEGLKANTWQSNLYDRARGEREASYGPYQLNQYGMGGKYERVTGHQVEDPAYVEEQVRFALDEAARGGWTPWHGWKGERWAGIRTPATGEVSDPMDVSGMARGSKMAAQNYNALDQTGTGDGTTTPQDTVGDLIGDELDGEDKKKPLSGLLGDLLKQPKMEPLQLSPPPAAANNVQSLPEYIQQYIAMRKMGGQGGGFGGGGMGGMGGQGLG